MRIQDNQNVHSAHAAGVESTRPSDSKSAGAAAARSRSVDQVHVSSDVRLASSTIEVAKNGPDIRPDVVARAEALLAAGGVGADSFRLADTLIDAALNDTSLHA
jgi:hypothetical protein